MHLLQADRPVTLDAQADLYIVPFGGCGEFGMNLTAYVCRGQLYVVDCGIMFPDQTKLGVDAVMPELGPWLAMFGKPHAYIITHGHEDHIGALPLVHPQWPAPIYATSWTAELIKQRFAKYDLPSPEIRTVRAGDTVTLGELSATYLAVNHSIPMTCALLIEAGQRRVFHTGDFKIDTTNRYEPVADLADFRRRCASGVDALVVDSTNAPSAGSSSSEDTVLEPLRNVCQSINGTIYLATFASNWWRLRTVFELAEQLGRKVLVMGAGMRRTVGVARDLGMLGKQSNIFLNESEVSHVPHHKLFVLLSGCQGEPRAALARLCRDEIKSLKLQRGDGVIFSSRIIPGAERAVYHLSALCAQKEVDVFTSRTHPGIHVSGHAYSEDINQLIDAVQPRYYLPVHGTFTQIMANRALAVARGIAAERCLVPEDGTVWRFDDKANELVKDYQFEVNWSFIDGYSKQQLTHQTLKERLKIGELGLAIISGMFDYTRGDWQVNPTIELRGLDDPAHKYWRTEAQEVVRVAVAGAIRRGIVDQAELDEKARLALRRYLLQFLQKKVVVVAHIHPV